MIRKNIYLLRHTKVNFDRSFCYGQLDVPLAATYPSELELVRNRLAHLTFSQTYSSPLSRCAQLARDISGQVILDNRLKEINFGQWEGVPWDHIHQSPAGKIWFDNYLKEGTPEGESFTVLQQRAVEFIDSLVPIQGNTLIVTHSGVIRAILTGYGLIKTDDAFKEQIEYGQVIKLET